VTVGHKGNSIRATDGLLALEAERRRAAGAAQVRWESLVIDHLAALLTSEPERFGLLAVAELYAPMVLGVLAARAEVTGAHLLLGAEGRTVRVAGSALVTGAAELMFRAVDVAAVMT